MKFKELPARVSWRLRRLSNAVGILGIAAILAVSAAAALRWHLLERERAVMEGTRPELLALNDRLTRAQGQEEKPGAAKMLDDFRSALPDTPAEASIEALARLQEAARVQGLVLQQGTYRIVAESDESFAHIEVVMSTKGSYPQLRRFALRALSDVPSLALTTARFSRQAVSDANVEGEFRFWLFLRQPA